MALVDRKIPIITGINDTPTTTGQPKHPNASLLCKQYNDLIDNELTALSNSIPTTATIRQAITVTGNATYDNSTGVISVNNADFAVDHISLTNTNGRFKTYTIWADSAETIDLGTFTVADGLNGTNGVDGTNGTNGIDGADGVDGRGIEKVTSVDNGNGTKTITFWGDIAETINLGNLILASGLDGTNGTDGRGITNTSYNASTGILTLTFSDATTFNTGDLRGANGTNGTNGTNGRGITNTSYNASTGIVTFTFSDATTFDTGDLRGAVQLNNNNVFTKAQRVATVPLTDGATINVDASLSNVFSVILGGNRTIANPTNLGAGQTIIFKIRQDATGNRTLTWGSAYRFPNNTPPTLSTQSNRLDVISCVSDGTNLYCNFVGGYQ